MTSPATREDSTILDVPAVVVAAEDLVAEVVAEGPAAADVPMRWSATLLPSPPRQKREPGTT